MPKSSEQKRIEAIRREILSYGGDYHKVPFDKRVQIRNTYLNLSLQGRVKIIEEFKVEFRQGFLFFYDPQ
jgi:hypothetical protein